MKTNSQYEEESEPFLFKKVDPNNTPLWIAIFFEFLGTFILILVGCGSVISNSGQVILVAFTFGFLLYSLIVAFQAKSGAHFNPAVSLAMICSRNVSPKRGLLLILAQLLGSLLGAGIMYGILPQEKGKALNWAVTDLSPGVSAVEGVFIELFATFILVMIIFRTGGMNWQLTEYKSNAPFAVGFVIVVDILFAGSLTGASMNPARSFGPAIVANYWTNHWIYWIGPCGGALLAVLCHETYSYISPLKISLP